MENINNNKNKQENIKQKEELTMNNEENKDFTKENQIIPEYVQSQAKRNLGYELTENIYKKYLTEMVENFLAVDENKWNCTKEEKQILLKFKEYKNKNNIEILDEKNINNFLKTDDYTKNKDIISDLYNLVYTPRGERTDEFHFAKQIKEITKTKNNINEQNKNNPFNNLTEGQIVEITIKNKNESSTAYYEIVKSKTKGELYLKPYSSDKYKPNTYQDCIANADAFKLNKLENLQNKNIDNVIRKKCFEFYNKNHETSTISAEEFNQYFEIKIKDITKQINKENNTQIEQKKTRKNNNDNSEVKIENYEITTIPQELQDMRKDKKLKPISTGEYTSEILKMLTSFHSIEDRDRNLSDFDKKQLKPILKIFDNKESMKDKQKAFNQFIFDNRNNTELMETIGRIYSKTQRNEYKGYEKKHSNKTKNDRDFILDAIKKNKFPLMNKEEEVNYIKNPINNSLYKGFEQLLLQTNNIVNNLKDTEYISINDLYKNGSVLNPEARMKAQIISNGKNNNGENVYTVVVPCSTTKRLTREERKMLKNLKKEEYRRTVHEAKFKRDFGKLPAFTTSVQPNAQQLPALPNNVNLKTEKFTGDIENIEEVLSHDAKNRFICSLTKEPYIPTVDWTKSPHKQELLKFASENPEKLKSISDLAYCNMKQEINEQINKNSKQNEQIEQRVNENQNTNSTKRNR